MAQECLQDSWRFIHQNGISNGLPIVRSIAYSYKDAATDMAGRGALGFGTVISTDEQTNFVTTATYQQAWPFTGTLDTSIVRSGSTIIAYETNNMMQRFTQKNSTSPPVFLFVASNNQCHRSPTDSQYICSQLANTYSLNPSDQDWGNPTTQATTRYSGTENFIELVQTAYKSCSSGWLHSLPELVTTRKIPSAGGAGITRTVQYDYDCATGLLNSEVAEPNTPALYVKTEYGRSGNAFGLANTKTQTWTDPTTQASATRVVSNVQYDDRGRYPIQAKNALDQIEAYSYEPGTGARKTHTDMNGLLFSWASDGFGRVSKEIHPDRNELRSYIKKCNKDCPAGAVLAKISDTFHDGDRIAAPVVSYSDIAGHLLRTLTWGFDGTRIVIDQRFDNMGRLFEVDHPRFDKADVPTYLASRQLYDVLNRVTSVSTKDEAGELQSTTMIYSNLTTTITNPGNQVRVEKRNALGQLVEVKDPNLTLTSFAYDPFGNLVQTTDPMGNVITVEYDILGRKTDLRDPDLGWIHYDVDPVGRTYKQTSPVQRAKLQSTTMSYDRLDRMTARYETDLESHWVYDDGVNSKGKLSRAYTGSNASNPYYDRTHSYDNLGRPDLTAQSMQSINYTSKTSYDSWGRVSQQTYQRGTDAAKKFDTRYNEMGYLDRLERGSMVLWQVTKQDASARSTAITLGNGLMQSRTYNDYTTRLSGASLTTAANIQHLSEGYTYDALGNVKTRDQHWDGAGFYEEFTYDNLNRISTNTLGAAKQIYTYNDAGSILSKTGVGNNVYHYPDPAVTLVRPHGVTSIDGMSGAFIYDDNGNLTKGHGNTATWTSFDMPARLTKDTVWADFVYGPEHQRTWQQRSDGSSVLYAGAQEVETKNGQVTVKTYWPFGVGVEIDKSTGTSTELNWIHVDRLGSPVAITGASGQLIERLAYDAWGQRRTTPDTTAGQVDNKGFTGHEMLDQLELVHMNGRVYDPVIGKFMSGDPFVQDPLNGQNYNRYSYVLNNPTNLTDPTGFAFSDCTGSRLCGGAIGGGGGNAVGMSVSCTGVCISPNDQNWFKEFSKQTPANQQIIIGAINAKNNPAANGSTISASDESLDAGGGTQPTLGSDKKNGIWEYRGAVKINKVKDGAGKEKEQMIISLSVSDINTGRGQEFVDSVNTTWTVSSSDGKLSILPRLQLGNGERADLELYMALPGSNGLGCGVTALACATLGGRSMFLNASSPDYSKLIWDWAFAHEFGHNIGLNHRSNAVPSIMNYRTQRITDEDIRSLFELYRKK